MGRLNDKPPVTRKQLLEKWDDIRVDSRKHWDDADSLQKYIAELIDIGNALADALEIWEEEKRDA